VKSAAALDRIPAQEKVMFYGKCDMTKNWKKTNRELWDSWTHLHQQADSDYAELINLVRSGGSTLSSDVIREVGDVQEKRMLHLMCHIGLDTLSWARSGALVTGLDFSAKAIALARALSWEMGIPANFHCADISQAANVLKEKFDIIFTSDGVLPWLSDLDQWADVIRRLLNPGGIFYLADMHPIRRLLLPRRVDDDGRPIALGYFAQKEPVEARERGSYALWGGEEVQIAYYWAHSLGEVVTALCKAGLVIEFLHETAKTAPVSQVYVQVEEDHWEIELVKELLIPNSFSIRASNS
jgi:2-polyprenyl-3-methyl-5-hydroxy-6-metoxy-1,4-benzoquinol methylase